MAQAAKRWCSVPYCKKFQVKDSRCEDHQRKRTPRATEWTAMYNDRRWKAYRLVFLAEHPLCCDPFGRHGLEAASVVDHIKPHRGDYDLFWAPDNHRALCASCNSYKGAKYEGGFGNAPRTPSVKE